jgi:hypothetical protein
VLAGQPEDIERWAAAAERVGVVELLEAGVDLRKGHRAQAGVGVCS